MTNPVPDANGLISVVGSKNPLRLPPNPLIESSRGVRASRSERRF